MMTSSKQDFLSIADLGSAPIKFGLGGCGRRGSLRAWGIGVNTPEPMLRVMQECDPDVCLLASQYSLIDHANALNNDFPVARQRNVKFVIGSSLNAGFISGSPRYNYGKTSWNIPRQYIEKRDRLRTVAAQFGADLRTAAFQFSAAPDVAAALIVGAHTEAQILANVLHAGDHHAGVLGRAKATESHRAERPHANRGLMQKCRCAALVVIRRRVAGCHSVRLCARRVGTLRHRRRRHCDTQCCNSGNHREFKLADHGSSPEFGSKLTPHQVNGAARANFY
jgi:hypothetical protein